MTANVVLHFVVTRIEAKSEQFDMYMQLDVNTDIYPLHEGDKFMMVLASTLNLDGTPDTGYFTPVIFSIFIIPSLQVSWYLFLMNLLTAEIFLHIEGLNTFSRWCCVWANSGCCDHNIVINCTLLLCGRGFAFDICKLHIVAAKIISLLSPLSYLYTIGFRSNELWVYLLTGCICFYHRYDMKRMWLVYKHLQMSST